MNKAMIESYARSLAGQVFSAVVIITQTSGLSSPLDFGSSEWLLVANTLWASLIPVTLRYINKKDPAFGLVAEVVASAATKEIEKKVTATKKPAAKRVSKK